MRIRKGWTHCESSMSASCELRAAGRWFARSSQLRFAMRAEFAENPIHVAKVGLRILEAGGEMNLRRAFALSIWWTISVLVWSQQPSEIKPATDRLAASIYNGPSMTTLGELADGIGGRLTASPAYVRSTEWAAAKFRRYGIENVRLEPFTIPAGWQRGTASGAMLAPLSRPLHLASMGWAPSTPSGGVQGSVVVVADVAPEALKYREAELRGKIVFLDTAKIKI